MSIDDNMKKWNRTAGMWLAEMREDKGWPQKELAERVGRSRSHVAAVEVGIAHATIQHIALVCETCDESLSDAILDIGLRMEK